ncbi:MAG: hypothetical protein ABUT20_59160 [Bacteroidota bacterium]
MTHSYDDLNVEELKKLLNQETKAFIYGIENGASLDELKAIRKRMRELTDLLEKRYQLKTG